MAQAKRSDNELLSRDTFHPFDCVRPNSSLSLSLFVIKDAANAVWPRTALSNSRVGKPTAMFEL